MLGKWHISQGATQQGDVSRARLVGDDECEICRAELTSSKMAEQNIKYERTMGEIENSIEAHQRSLSTIDVSSMRAVE